MHSGWQRGQEGQTVDSDRQCFCWKARKLANGNGVKFDLVAGENNDNTPLHTNRYDPLEIRPALSICCNSPFNFNLIIVIFPARSGSSLHLCRPYCVHLSSSLVPESRSSPNQGRGQLFGLTCYADDEDAGRESFAESLAVE